MVASAKSTNRGIFRRRSVGQLRWGQLTRGQLSGWVIPPLFRVTGIC